MLAHIPKIAIIGGGPAGLTLARILQQSHIATTAFEAEPSRDSRQQGGTLDLHPESGQRALRAAGLEAEFLKLVRPGEDAMRVSDPSGELLHDECPDDPNREPDGPPRPPGYQNERPEVDRIELRGVLLDSLSEGTVRWGAKVTGVVPADTPAQWELELAGGEKVGPFDLVVGADGAWSRVRPLLHEHRPYYSGVAGLEVWLREVDERNPALGKLVGKGNYAAFGDGKALIAQRNGDKSIRVYAFRIAPEDWLKGCGGYDWTDPKSKDAFVEAEFIGWQPAQRSLVLKADPDVVPRNLYMLPVGVSWEPKPGLTLIGDAAHLMTPFAGEGANLAMLDALTLAEAIITALRPATDGAVNNVTRRIAEATASYESQMYTYVLPKAKETEDNLKALFGPGGARAMIAAMGPPPDGEGNDKHS